VAPAGAMNVPITATISSKDNSSGLLTDEPLLT
jgi:hypothetical protein